jgi:hypothetical protein
MVALAPLRVEIRCAWLGDHASIKSAATRAIHLPLTTGLPKAPLHDEAVEKYHAIEGGQQTLSNLAAYVTEIVRKGAEG